MRTDFSECEYYNQGRCFGKKWAPKCDGCDEQKLSLRHVKELKHAISTCESQMACWKSTCGDMTLEPKTEVMLASRRFVRDYDIMKDLLEKEYNALMK
ncbi:hypothetical protein [Chryseobacterium sp.]|uniref:hypothetical protein n=1 Tax=Chryseobacterium sp. TaxID=1871047 RepID=UPI002FC689E1